jgi:hypothetical protein
LEREEEESGEEEDCSHPFYVCHISVTKARTDDDISGIRQVIQTLFKLGCDQHYQQTGLSTFPLVTKLYYDQQLLTELELTDLTIGHVTAVPTRIHGDKLVLLHMQW